MATVKIASRWSDGSTHEFKTYALTCEGCANQWLLQAEVKRADCRQAVGESLDPPQILPLRLRNSISGSGR
ncbi:MAG: hypothetical protein ACRCZF_07875 [Gemmataceae bacterium]